MLVQRYTILVSDFEDNERSLSIKEQENLKLSEQLDEINAKVKLLQEKVFNLRNDSIQNGNSLILLQDKFDELNASYDLLVSKNTRQMSEKAKETKLLLEQLDEVQSKLLKKEDELNELSLTLKNKENELNKAQKDLNERSERVIELEKIIQQKDSSVTAIKRKFNRRLLDLRETD